MMDVVKSSKATSVQPQLHERLHCLVGNSSLKVCSFDHSWFNFQHFEEMKEHNDFAKMKMAQYQGLPHERTDQKGPTAGKNKAIEDYESYMKKHPDATTDQIPLHRIIPLRNTSKLWFVEALGNLAAEFYKRVVNSQFWKQESGRLFDPQELNLKEEAFKALCIRHYTGDGKSTKTYFSYSANVKDDGVPCYYQCWSRLYIMYHCCKFKGLNEDQGIRDFLTKVALTKFVRGDGGRFDMSPMTQDANTKMKGFDVSKTNVQFSGATPVTILMYLLFDDRASFMKQSIITRKNNSDTSRKNVTKGQQYSFTISHLHRRSCWYKHISVRLIIMYNSNTVRMRGKTRRRQRRRRQSQHHH